MCHPPSEVKNLSVQKVSHGGQVRSERTMLMIEKIVFKSVIINNLVRSRGLVLREIRVSSSDDCVLHVLVNGLCRTLERLFVSFDFNIILFYYFYMVVIFML